VRWSLTGRPVAAGVEMVLDDHEAHPLDGQAEELVATFAGLPHRQLVVLGAAGAGKTVVAAMLTLGMIERRGPDDPVPVMLGSPRGTP
jgi:predicted NACHT family NTPase